MLCNTIKYTLESLREWFNKLLVKLFALYHHQMHFIIALMSSSYSTVFSFLKKTKPMKWNPFWIIFGYFYIKTFWWLYNQKKNGFLLKDIVILGKKLYHRKKNIFIILGVGEGRWPWATNFILPCHILFFLSSGSHGPQSYGIPCQSIWVFPELLRF